MRAQKWMQMSKNIFVSLIPKGSTKPHYAIFSQTISLIMTSPTAHCSVLIFYIKYIVNDEMVFQKNGVVILLPLDICVINIFFDIFIWSFGPVKSHLKLAKMTEIQLNFNIKTSGKNLKIMFCDTHTQRQRTPLRSFFGKYLLNVDPPYWT